MLDKGFYGNIIILIDMHFQRIYLIVFFETCKYLNDCRIVLIIIKLIDMHFQRFYLIAFFETCEYLNEDK